MSAHFKWYDASEEVVVPWNARYSFPSQANKCTKITPRIPPKNGATFLPGNVIRLEFPAQGYINPINTTFEFDVTLSTYSIPGTAVVRFQNNIQSIFSRARFLYGATPLEDIINYNVIVRSLTEWTATNQTMSMDQTSIAEGIGGVVYGYNGDGSDRGMVNVRQAYIQGIDATATTGFGAVPNQSASPAGYSVSCTRRYQVNLAFGLLMQDKLLPTKFMASQLAIELSLAQESECILVSAVGSGAGLPPTYQVSNFNMIPEILEFDAAYDSAFLRGLQDTGVPIKLSSWHTFIFSVGGSSAVNLMIQERSRSVKALFAVQRRNPSNLLIDQGATLFNSATSGTLQNYQYRIGGRYFPAAPVQLSTSVGSNVPNCGAEAYVELQKALNIVGDYRLSTSNNSMRWGQTCAAVTVNGDLTTAQESDYGCYPLKPSAGGINTYKVIDTPFAGSVGSSCFTMACDLETSNGIEISGLNAEEQSDIALMVNWSQPQAAGYNMEVYSYFDEMILLKENNVLELIQ